MYNSTSLLATRGMMPTGRIGRLLNGCKFATTDMHILVPILLYRHPFDAIQIS